jgi:hypothetical protein
LHNPGNRVGSVKVNGVCQNKRRVERSGVTKVPRAAGLTTLAFTVGDLPDMLCGKWRWDKL